MNNQFDYNLPALIIPLLNEKEAFPLFYNSLPDHWQKQLLVVDNGSTDGTIQWLRNKKIYFLIQKKKGYGAACFSGFKEAQKLGFTTLIYSDGDSLADVISFDLILNILQTKDYSFVFSSRHNYNGPWHARFGTILLVKIINFLWSICYEDLGPLRGMKIIDLEALNMLDRSFGWTIEMQIKVIKEKKSFIEIPVVDLKRVAGVSKISGSILGSFLAAKCLILHILKLKLNDVSKLNHFRK